jgi:hypothetical protein
VARRHAIGPFLLVWMLSASAAAAGQETRRPPPRLEVNFSAPVEGEADVRLDAIIRVQFSRDVDAKSFDNRIRVSYSAEESSERGEATPPRVAFAADYDPGTRALTIKPSQALERFRHVTVELLNGIHGTDGSVLKPWSLHFATGGS